MESVINWLNYNQPIIGAVMLAASILIGIFVGEYQSRKAYQEFMKKNEHLFGSSLPRLKRSPEEQEEAKKALELAKRTSGKAVVLPKGFSHTFKKKNKPENEDS